MKTRTLWQKLKSTKVWAMVGGIVVAVLIVCGADSGEIVDAVKAIAGAVAAIVSVVTYISTEGRIDAAAVGQIDDAVDKTEAAVDQAGSILNGLRWYDPAGDEDDDQAWVDEKIENVTDDGAVYIRELIDQADVEG